MTKLQLVLVWNLIGSESGASSLDQSLNEVKQINAISDYLLCFVSAIKYAKKLLINFSVPYGRVKLVLLEVYFVDSSSSFHHASSYGTVPWDGSCGTE